MADEFESNGWAAIHNAAHRGFLKSIDFFLSEDQEFIELETRDELHMTPFLCSIDGNKIEAVEHLMKAGAKVDTINAHNHGAVELCALKQYIEMLEFLIKLDHTQIPVWKNIIRFLSSESEEEAESAGKCLEILTLGSKADGINPKWEPFYNHGGVTTIVKVAKSSISDEAKIPAFRTLLNIIERNEVKEQIASSGGIPVFIKLLKSNNHFVVQLAAEILRELAPIPAFAEPITQNNGIPSLVKVLQTIHNPEVLIPVTDCLGNLAEADSKYQSQIGNAQGCMQQIVTLLEENRERELLHALARAVGKIANDDQNNQNTFVSLGVTVHIVTLTRLKNKDVQTTAVEAIHKLANNNPDTQKIIVSEKIPELLLKLLKDSRAEQVQEKTALALWALAGTEFDVKRYIAEKIGVNLLVQFCNTLSDNLHYMGSECLGILAQGPLNFQSEISASNGITPLRKHLGSDKEYIVLSVIRTIRYLCLGVGYVTHKKNQNMILQLTGIKSLVALMIHSRSEEIQIESALTLAAVSLGNQPVLDEIKKYPEFSYVRILKLMYSSDPMVRLLAGLALATFAYNNIAEQKEIADQGGVRFNCFAPFLQSNDEMYRCLAAFQVVVLARIIPDEEQALSSAAGIKLIVDILQDSMSNETISLACDCIARLAHTRAGVPAAIVSIDAVNLLCQQLLSPAEQIRGCASIALGYLSFNHSGERQILNRCRADPYLMRVLLHYTKNCKISPDFLKGWQHYKKVGLPPVQDGRPNLVGFIPPDGPGISIDTISNTPSSSSNTNADEGRIGDQGSTSRTISRHDTGSRTDGTPIQAETPINASQISLESSQSPQLQEIAAE
ncbi:ankyrin and armadillo repeat-containing protein-like [Mytilus edulis]|uniref:ankyrin and armadillo repeat-containing protein-like n=1 Tax=Mytilus edulis TaxID=6550 RepID=UPI0039EFD890